VQQNRELIDMMDQKATELDQTLDKLIKIAEINDSQPRPQIVNLEKLAEQVLQEIAMKYLDVNCEIAKSFKNKAFRTDRFYLKAILENLITNAFQFSNKKALKIELTSNKKDDQLELVVADNGPGIKPSIQPNVFNMFVRGDREKSGSGLGLYLVKIAVEKLDGSIDLKSDPTGSQFTIMLRALSPGKRSRILD
jgi:signal transduction histidine kinase